MLLLRLSIVPDRADRMDHVSLLQVASCREGTLPSLDLASLEHPVPGLLLYVEASLAHDGACHARPVHQVFIRCVDYSVSLFICNVVLDHFNEEARIEHPNRFRNPHLLLLF